MSRCDKCENEGGTVVCRYCDPDMGEDRFIPKKEKIHEKKVATIVEDRLSYLEAHILAYGIPVNIRYGTSQEVIAWMESITEGLKPKEEASGTINLNGMEVCPACHAVIGQSAYYCKRCGRKIRVVPEYVMKQLEKYKT